MEKERQVELMEAQSRCKGEKDIVALFYNDETHNYNFVNITFGDLKSIQSYLVTTDGVAKNYKIKDNDYWVIDSQTNLNFLMFRRSLDSIPFASVTSDDFIAARHITTF